jgi:exonuclease III
MAEITTHLSVLTLNVNGFDFSIKRHCLANWIKNEDATICCFPETYLMDRNKHCLIVKGWKEIYQANGPQNRQEEQYLDKVHFKPELVRKNKEGHIMLIKREIYQEEITIVKLYAPNIHVPNFTKHILLNLTQIDPQHSGGGRFNPPLLYLLNRPYFRSQSKY